MTRAGNTQGVALSEVGLPGWLEPVARAVRTVQPGQLSRFLPRPTAPGGSPPY